MASRRKLIVASNRAPVSYSRDEEGNRVARRGGGGLVTALRSLVSEHDVTMVGSAMSDEDRAVADENGGEAFEETARDGSPYRLRFVTSDPAAYDWFYNVVANPTLWFLQHHLWDLAYEPQFDQGLHHAWDEGYVTVNRDFASAIAAEVDRHPDAAIFLQDYHLYLVAGMLREQLRDAPIAHFVHIPWPEPDLWGVLPGPIRLAVHEGLLGNDVVSFHTERWARNFMRSCTDILGAERGPNGSLVVGERTVVGVNRYASAESGAIPTLKIDERPEREQVAAVAALRARRDAARAREGVELVRRACQDDRANVMEAVLEAARRDVTLGEICRVFRDVFGEYRDPAEV